MFETLPSLVYSAHQEREGGRVGGREREREGKREKVRERKRERERKQEKKDELKNCGFLHKSESLRKTKEVFYLGLRKRNKVQC